LQPQSGLSVLYSGNVTCLLFIIVNTRNLHKTDNWEDNNNNNNNNNNNFNYVVLCN